LLPMSNQPDAEVVARILAEVAARNPALPEPRVRRAIRVAARWTLAQVAEALRPQVDPVTVGRWEKGQREPTGAVRESYSTLLEFLRREAQ
jgi:DNA-binding transcriptional regulator YiaG